ncbi:MAG: YcaQ family DNA glycosylase [Erysipelotrichaceae bacterium]|nr:YcaQ family DNA glycosylase [Erysipelotrichaceae bacterium]
MSDSMTISKKTARRFILMKQGLFGDYKFAGKQGALEFVRQAGCIQFDPVDSVGKNAELTLQSRLKGFRKKDLYNLLYRDRELVDYFDKELSIFPVESWPYFKRYRDLCRKNGERFEGLAELEEKALDHIRRKGNVSSSSLPIEGEIRWHSSIHWSGSWDGNMTKASRSVLEQLYTTGDLIIHHKKGTRKYYDLAEKYIAAEILNSEDPLPDHYDHCKWRVKRRIGAVGLLWNKNSMAYLGILDLSSETRNRIFEDLLKDGEITEVQVEGIGSRFYLLSEDLSILEKAMDESLTSNRCEFMAPLDPMLWDKQLIEKIFDFKYSWEIYVPQEKRKYGYYVLPLLYGDRFVGRIEPVIKDGKLIVRNIWLEPGIRMTKKLNKAIESRLKKFARFNECEFEDNK